MRVEEAVGIRIRQERERAGLSQSQLGIHLAPLLGRTWPRQAISHAEAGKRAFTAVELIAFARVIGCDPGRLLTPPQGVDKIVMPSGEALARAEVVAHQNSDAELDEMRGHVAQLVAHGIAVQSEGRQVEMHARAVYNALDSLARAVRRTGSDDGAPSGEFVRGENG